MLESIKNDHLFYNFRSHLRLLRWVIPLVLVGLVLLYEFVIGPWLDEVAAGYHLFADLLLFGTFGPLLAFVLLYLLERWLEERETSELQGQILTQVRAKEANGRQLNDDAMQVLFSAGMLIEFLKSGKGELPKETAVQVAKMEVALQESIQRLRGHLLAEGNGQPD